MNMRNLALWAVIAALLIALFSFLQPQGEGRAANKISYSKLLEEAKNGRVQSVEIDGQTIKGIYVGGQTFTTQMYPFDMSN